MSVWGKLIGGLCGYLLTHAWWGMLLGVWLGHQFDRGLKPGGGGFSASFRVLNLARIQRSFFETTFSVMGHLAKADGRVSEAEIAPAPRATIRAASALPDCATRA